jgi:CheY-like chemotaxis protein
LALVQELIKQHGGTIDASSEPGRGTSFAVRIPFGTAHLPAQQIKTRQARSSTAIGAQAFVQEALRWLQDVPADVTTTLATLAATSADARDRRFVTTFGLRIVLADDNSDMRGYMRELLAPYYDVEALADGEQALAAARRERPDLILSDVMMPRLDGFGLLATIRADPSLGSVPVVLLSARAGEEARIEGLDAGVPVAQLGAMLQAGGQIAARQDVGGRHVPEPGIAERGGAGCRAERGGRVGACLSEHRDGNGQERDGDERSERDSHVLPQE